MNAIAISIGPADYCRKLIIAASLGAAMLFSLASCKKDDPAPLPEIKSQTYTSSSLALTYQEEDMPGKSVDLEYSSSDPNSAVLRLYSEFDLSQLSGTGLTGTVAGPGVLPGSPDISIPVTLIPGDGCYTFSGSGSTEYIEYKYSGSLKSGLLTLALSDCQLKSQVFAGSVFSPAPLEKDGLLTYKSMPFHLLWEIDPEDGIDIPLSDILKAAVVAPVIPVYNNTAYTSVAQMFDSAVKTIAMTPSGNIPVMYISTVGGAARIATTCGNMLQYVPASNGIRLYVNPLSALSQVLVALSKPSSDADFITKAGVTDDSDGNLIAGIDPKIKAAIIQSLAAAFAPQLRDGIPLTVSATDAGAEIYFDTQTSVTFLSQLLGNLLKNPEISDALQAYLASLDLPGVSQEDLAGILQALPGFLEKTTRLEIGLSLVKS